MPYIGRGQVGDLIQPTVLTGLFSEKTYNSVIMTLGTRVPVGTKENIIPIEGDLPVAEFVEKTGTQATPTAGTYPAVDVDDAPDIGYKPVSAPTIGSKRLVLEKVAVIVPMSDCVMEDLPDAAAFEAWVRRKSEQAIAKRFDQAALLGVNPPATYGAGIIAGAIAKGNVVDVAADATSTAKLQAVLDAYSLVEGDGYTVDGIAARTDYRAVFRNAMISNPNIIIDPSTITTRPAYVLYGVPITDAPVLNGTAYGAVVGQWSNVYWGMRDEFQITQSNEANLTNADGSTYNLFQQDMTAIRVVARIGYAVVDDATGYPLAVVRETTGE